MSIAENITLFNKQLEGTSARLIAVSKTKPNEDLLQAYESGQRAFGENKVQELVAKAEALPKDIEWHMIGHLQRNKVKYIAPFVSLIHGVDSERLLKEIDKQAAKNERIINCLLQVHIAEEDTKFGFDEAELMAFLNSEVFDQLSHIKVIGLMGMATNTDNMEQVRKEFASLKKLSEKIKNEVEKPNLEIKELSMGMTSDYKIACEEGSTMIRVGSAIFGARNYPV
ncbi:YggS family pyridoxal phosphate-dependent enzyme [Roseivirga pacifica]|uniref:YggS family pyridoxal phosphate-dependent enzyme n=1 Tax=Roseivirga pacifica TaxID=1267423 RepID=UPI00209646D9|nr:YggS family pyridoxal phosphate-dependent enzyme [Roseivirga pacifica]MCO6360276.1 YggS family pyridoxal phosphate-dependent enzyme [Roseivirga pacifica]MCO6367647.1 YggS family pyridoxal phosphate-dependent enzyme [Roseivirga pacifica]MCO6369821.1 YggS family pyridoxal phosphate-dependent enzyme [Roseivirga pacifica]MCO6375304.1 YggS family pyridoxal phosphate-dependent enzyme [Roseivirga pacifica]MCO6380562.1 YggS family pyridoxal phosphate-dependent enzyme [Roseivirga pacifica]